VKGFLRLFMNYGLVASILVATALVGVLAYRLEGSRWRWPLAALVLAGFGTVAGIFWIRRYVDKQTKASEQGSQQ
jgi:F0F1-type ATP synthase assembly protein I